MTDERRNSDRTATEYVIPHDSILATQMRTMAPVAANVTLWWCDLDAIASGTEPIDALLAPAERTRAARFGNETLRGRWIAGRGALRTALGLALGLPPAEVDIRRGARGRPELASPVGAPDFNISHTNGVAVIGIARGARIGIDVERSDRAVGADRLARKFLAPAEQAALAGLADEERRARFLKYWTCKEAMSKATGDGLIAPFARLCVDLQRLQLLDGPPPYTPTAWTLHSAAASPPYLVTVALWQPRSVG